MDFDTNFGLAIVAVCLTVGGMVVLKVNQAMHLTNKVSSHGTRPFKHWINSSAFRASH